jgi:DNA-binding PadR family transcriptional regulator
MIKQPGTTLTPLAVAVLTLLEERPMHPYEMYQLLLQRREDYLIKIRPGSLYHTVTRLAEQGLAESEGTDRAGNRPERTTYRITPAGAAAVRGRISEILRRPVREYPLFPVAMAEAHTLPADEVIGLLTERIRWLDKDLIEFDALSDWTTAHGVPRRYWMVIEYLRGQVEAERAWLRRIIDELRDGTLVWEKYTPEGIRLPAEDKVELGADWGTAVTDESIAEFRKGCALPADQ